MTNIPEREWIINKPHFESQAASKRGPVRVKRASHFLYSSVSLSHTTHLYIHLDLTMDNPYSSSEPPPYDPHTGQATAYQQPNRPVRPTPRKRQSIMDELIPLPNAGPDSKSTPLIPWTVLRRTASVGVISVFLLSIVFLASTQSDHTRTGLRTIFGVGSDAGIGGAGWVAQDLGEVLNGGSGSQGRIGQCTVHRSFLRDVRLKRRFQSVYQDEDDSSFRSRHHRRKTINLHRRYPWVL